MIDEALDIVAKKTIDKINQYFDSKEYKKLCKRRKADEGNRVVGLSWNLTYSNSVSNSHHAPKGKPTNWGAYDKEIPRGYPGFSGRIWIRYENQPVSFGSSPFDGTCVHTGTGGAGNYRHPIWERLGGLFYKRSPKLYDKVWHPFSWDVKIFIEDFPELEQAVMVEILKSNFNNGRSQRAYNFAWEDTDQCNSIIRMFELREKDYVL